MRINKAFPSKLILFGEYSLLIGSNALAVPYHKQYGRLVLTQDGVDKRLQKWLNFLLQEPNIDFLNLDKMQSEMGAGLHFISNIKQGYGMGSSGALCAAIYNKYLLSQNEINMNGLKTRLSLMEDYFHLNSSGIDPLVSYLNSKILLKEGTWQPIPDIGGALPEYNLFLLDTGSPRKTSLHVAAFREMILEEAFHCEMEVSYIPIVNRAINEYLNKDEMALFKTMDQISRWQMAHLGPMIPDNISPFFFKGIEDGSYRLKLCGAGGGGYFLGMSEDREKTILELKGEKIVWL